MRSQYLFATCVYALKTIYNIYNPSPSILFNISDATHIVVSQAYYVFACTPTLERIDYACILLKMVLNGWVVFGSPDPISVLLCYIGIIFHGDFVNRDRRSTILFLVYVAVIRRGFIDLMRHGPWMLAYAVGGGLWALRFPERLGGVHVYLNSLGWNHVGVWLGDVLLLRARN